MMLARYSGLACLFAAFLTGLAVHDAANPLMLFPFLALAGWLLASGKTLSLHWKDPVLLVLLGLSLTWTASFFVSDFAFNSKVTLLTVSVLPLSYMIWQSLALNEHWQKIILYTLLGGATLLAIKSAASIFFADYWRAGWPFLDPNLLGILFSLILLATLPLMNGTAPLTRRILLVCASLLVTGLMATQSRSALLGTLAGVILLAVAYRRYLISDKRSWFAVAAFAGLVALCLAFTGFTSRLVSLLSGDTDVLSRISLWSTALEMSLAHPLTGFGIGTFGMTYPLFREPGGDNSIGWWVHMDPLQWAVESGCATPLLFYGLCIFIGLRLWRLQLSPLQLGSAAALLSLFVSCHTTYPLYVIPFMILCCFFLSIVFPRQQKETEAGLRYVFAAPVILGLIAGLWLDLRSAGTLYLWDRVQESRRTNIYVNFEKDMTSCLERADPDFPFCRLLLIETTLQMSAKPGEALLPLIQLAKEDFPLLPQPDYFLGRYYQKLFDEQPGMAIAAFRDSVTKMPTFWIGRKALVEALTADKQYAQALAVLTAGGKFPIPASDEAYYNLWEQTLQDYMKSQE